MPTTPGSQIISRDESYKRVLTVYKEAKSYYFLDYDGYDVIDAVSSLGRGLRAVTDRVRTLAGTTRQLVTLHQPLVSAALQLCMVVRG